MEATTPPNSLIMPTLLRKMFPQSRLKINRPPMPETPQENPRGFLAIFPREIRDLIYTYVLASSSNVVTLAPWSIEVAQSMTLLLTCKQIQRECKELIWRHNGLSLRPTPEIYTRFSSLMEANELRRIRHMEIHLELLDKDDLEWATSGLQAFAHLHRRGPLQSITLVAIHERVRGIKEYEEELDLMLTGEYVDGRLFGAETDEHGRKLIIKTSWPHFSHWGKQKWVKEMLMDRSDTTTLIKDIHATFGGDLFIDGSLCFKNGEQVSEALKFNPREGKIKIVPWRIRTKARTRKPI